jgi:NAD-dependent dihydropyrimidine dehydrogenase PreA subunit
MSDEFILKMLGDIKREEIHWNPSIDLKRCTNCKKCLEFCQHNVYGLEDLMIKVKNPTFCIILCNKCESICPVQAINFPKRVDILKEIRSRHQLIKESK